MSRSSSDKSQPSSAVPTDAVRPSFGPSGSEAITSGQEISRSRSASEHAKTGSRSTSTGLDSDDISVSSKKNRSMGPSSSNSRPGISHSGSHQRLGSSDSIQYQPEGDVLCEDGFEAIPADTRVLSDVAGHSREASIRSQLERGSSGTEKESSSSGLAEKESNDDLGTNKDVSFSSDIEMPGADALDAALESVSSSQFIDSDDSAYAPGSSNLRTSSTADAGPDSDDYSPEEQACSSSMVADVESSIDASFPSFLEMNFLTR